MSSCTHQETKTTVPSFKYPQESGKMASKKRNSSETQLPKLPASSTSSEDTSCPLCSEDNAKLSKTEWIACDHCKTWYHDTCLGISIEESDLYATLHCPSCAATYGESVKKRVSSRKRSKIDYVALNLGETNATSLLKGLHPHIARLVSYNGDNGVDIETKDKYFYVRSGDEITKQFIDSCGFNKPILVPASKLQGSGMEMPKDLSVSDVAEAVGKDTPVEVMDVMTQDALKGWTLGQWRDYFEDESDRDRIRNVISLEISSSELGSKVRRPKVVEDLDVIDKAWPELLADSRKSVAKYCLMSVKDLYTDFHLDFAGTQVYYHVIRGEKKFLMFPPTRHNNKAYTKWSLLQDQNLIFFPDYLQELSQGRLAAEDQGFTITLRKGDLMLIPSGWIHAVYTPENSVVIGGNFLTLTSMPQQLEVVQIEKQTKVPAKFAFPQFQKAMWYVAKWLVDQRPDLSKFERIGAASLCRYLQTTLEYVTGCCFDVNEKRKIKASIPRKVIGDPTVLLKELSEFTEAAPELKTLENTQKKTKPRKGQTVEPTNDSDATEDETFSDGATQEKSNSNLTVEKPIKKEGISRIIELTTPAIELAR